jgi:hypothetical protein
VCAYETRYLDDDNIMITVTVKAAMMRKIMMAMIRGILLE